MPKKQVKKKLVTRKKAKTTRKKPVSKKAASKKKADILSTYTAAQIKVLEGLEPVRRRPGMFIGSTDSRGLHHLVTEVIDNSVDESLAGFAKNIWVTIHSDNKATIKDDGRGIPTDIHSKYKKSGVEIVMTKLHAGGKFDKDSYKVSGGLHGVGVSVVNALSEWLCVKVKRDGKVYFQKYERGNPKHELKVIGTVEKEDTGTEVTFMPDPEIFETLEFNYDVLAYHTNSWLDLRYSDRNSCFNPGYH